MQSGINRNPKTRHLVGYMIIACVFLSGLWSNAIAQLSEPVAITISEAKPVDITGVDRTDDLASFGIPLKDADEIYSISQLGLSGADVYQFRALGRYPSGNIKWVLVDLITSVDAGQSTTVDLVNGSGNSAQSALASESGNTITLDTGAAVFTIAKNNFNFLDTVTVNGSQIISSGNSKGIVINDGTTEYTSQNDGGSTTIIEENGPAKAVIKSIGTMRNGADSYLYYTARLFFVRNQSYVKAQVTLRNAENDVVKEAKPVSEFAVSLQMNASGDIAYVFAREEGQPDVTGTGNGYLFQGYSEKYYTTNDQVDCNLIVDRIGLEIDGNTYLSTERVFRSGSDRGLGERGDPDGEGSQGYAQMTDGNNYINMAMPFMGGYWPGGFEIGNDGTAEIAAYSQRNGIDPLIAWSQHQTREMIFEFNNSAIDPQNTLFKIQYPLRGYAGFEQYRNAGAAFGETKLVSVDEEETWRDYHYPRFYRSGDDSRPDDRPIDSASSDAGGYNNMEVDRLYIWGVTGFQNDFYEVDLIDWMRTGNWVLFNRVKEAVRFRTDDAAWRSDGFSWKDDPPSDSESSRSGVYADGYNRSHMYWESTPLTYYLTGDEYIKDGLIDLAEYVDFDSSETNSRAQYSLYGLRPYTRIFKHFILMTEFFNATGDTIRENYYRSIIHNMTKQYIVYFNDDSGQYPGRDYDRGFYDINTGAGDHAIIDHMTFRIHPDTNYQLWRLFEDSNDDQERHMAEDLSDAMLGWGYFYLNNEMVTNDTFINDFGEEVCTASSAFNYSFHETNPDSEYTYRGEGISLIAGHSYDLTGNQEFFKKRRGAYLTEQNRGAEALAARGYQSFIYRDLYKDDADKKAPNSGYINPVGDGEVTLSPSNVVDHGDGTYTLTWTVPVQISHYQIKYSDQPMVENLGFDQETRQFQYDPDSYDNFWAAFNVHVSEENTPLAEGQTQTVTIDLQNEISNFNNLYQHTDYFGNINGLNDTNHPRYRDPDNATGYYFAIKYWTGDPIAESLNAYFTASRTTATLGESVQFYDTSNGNPHTWLWDFGDGQTSDERHPTHTYQSAGIYTVSLTVANGSDSDTQTRTNFITVTEPAPDNSGGGSSPGGSGGGGGCFIRTATSQ